MMHWGRNGKPMREVAVPWYTCDTCTSLQVASLRTLRDTVDYSHPSALSLHYLTHELNMSELVENGTPSTSADVEMKEEIGPEVNTISSIIHHQTTFLIHYCTLDVS